MAAGGRLLVESDRVTDQLISHVAHHVYPKKRKQFAVEYLKLGDAQYENIEADAEYSEKINYEASRKSFLLYVICVDCGKCRTSSVLLLKKEEKTLFQL